MHAYLVSFAYNYSHLSVVCYAYTYSLLHLTYMSSAFWNLASFMPLYYATKLSCCTYLVSYYSLLCLHSPLVVSIIVSYAYLVFYDYTCYTHLVSIAYLVSYSLLCIQSPTSDLCDLLLQPSLLCPIYYAYPVSSAHLFFYAYA